jgi:ribosomal protein L29
MLSQKLIRSVSAAMVLVMASGCATTPDGRKTQAHGTAIGAVLGAVVGGAVGYAAGGRSGLARGAAIGAGAGAVAGFAYGTPVAKRKAEYASREAWLDACIASAHRVNSNAYAYSRSLESRIARLESRARAARTSHNKSEARAIKREIAAIQTEAKQKTVVVTKEINDQQQAVTEGRGAKNYGGLKSEVNSLQETKGTLGRQVNRLAGIENQLDV